MTWAPRRRDVLVLGVATMLASSCTPVSSGRLTLAWERLPDLPQALGGQLAGVHHGALMVAGGSYFITPPWDGGAKQWVDTVYVLTDPAASWQTFRLPAAFGYGASVSSAQGLFLIGGGDSSENRRQVLRLQWNGRVVEISESPSLPVPLANCCAGLIGSTMYVFGGQEAPTATSASSALFSFDLAQPEGTWRPEATLPAPGRILPAVAVVGGKLYAVSGAALSAGDTGQPVRRYLQDAWCFHPRGGWEEIPAPPRIAVASPAWGSGNHLLVFGGDDGRFAAQPDLRDQHPGFPREVLSLNTSTGIWAALPAMPAGLVTTTATEWNGRIVIPGGEDRPAHRSAEVHACLPMGAPA
ncbi:MAG: hypothetical protein KIT83_00870 [Bryobacterales bacterium]|nr:hypothetical protein [Bryobacterales bacterium]